MGRGSDALSVGTPCGSLGGAPGRALAACDAHASADGLSWEGSPLSGSPLRRDDAGPPARGNPFSQGQRTEAVTAHPLLQCAGSGDTAASAAGSAPLDAAVAAAAACSGAAGGLRTEASLRGQPSLDALGGCAPAGGNSTAAVAAAAAELAAGGREPLVPGAADPPVAGSRAEAARAPAGEAGAHVRALVIPEPRGGGAAGPDPLSGELTATSLCLRGSLPDGQQPGAPAAPPQPSAALLRPCSRAQQPGAPAAAAADNPAQVYSCKLLDSRLACSQKGWSTH